MLRSAALTKVGSQPPPQAAPMTLDDILEDGWDAKLAQVEGYLTDRVANSGRERLTIVQGTRTIVAELPDGQSPRVEVGSLVKVTGVSVIDAAAAGNISIPRGVTLYLRSVDDIAVVANPPWWTAQRTLTLAAGPRRRHARHAGLGRPAAAPRVEADRRPALGQGRRRGGQPGQERVPGQRQPRDPDADERRARA